MNCIVGYAIMFPNINTLGQESIQENKMETLKFEKWEEKMSETLTKDKVQLWR